MFAGPVSGSPDDASFRALVGADLPLPTTLSLGGVKSITPVAHQFVTGISTAGGPAPSGSVLRRASPAFAYPGSTTGPTASSPWRNPGLAVVAHNFPYRHLHRRQVATQVLYAQCSPISAAISRWPARSHPGSALAKTTYLDGTNRLVCTPSTAAIVPVDEDYILRHFPNRLLPGLGQHRLRHHAHRELRVHALRAGTAGQFHNRSP